MSEETNNQVFVVTTGSYSDYSINAMFSNRKFAEDWIALKKTEEYYSDEDFNIEIWGIDAERTALLFRSWSCGIILDSGEIVENQGDGLERVEVPFRGLIQQHAIKIPAYSMRFVSRVRSGVSREHCNKLAVEVRQRWLREEALAEGSFDLPTGSPVSEGA